MLQQHIDAEEFAELLAYDRIEGVPHPVREAGVMTSTTIAVNTVKGKTPDWRECMGLPRPPGANLPLSSLRRMK